MSNKKIAIKITINILFLVILTAIKFFVYENTIITNDIALGQMNNSDEVYLLMEYYNRVRATISTGYNFISALIIGTTIYDIYKFMNNKGEN